MSRASIPLKDHAEGTSSTSRLISRSLTSIMLYWVLAALFPSEGFSLIKLAYTPLLVLPCAFLVAEAAKSARLLLRATFVSAILTLLILWCLFTILRAIDLTPQSLVTLATNPAVGGLSWLLPIFALLGREKDIIRDLLPTFRLHSLAGIPISAAILYDGLVLGNSRTFQDLWVQLIPIITYSTPIILLLKIGNRRDHVFSLIILSMVAAASIVADSRLHFVFCAAVILYYLFTSSPKFGRIVILVSLMVVLPIFLDMRENVIQGTWAQDTRSFIVEETSADFTEETWIIGKGALGTYYSRYFDQTRLEGRIGDSSTRTISELGYLHLVLKGGLIMALLYSAAFAAAAAKSLLRAAWNASAISLGISALLTYHLLELFISGTPAVIPMRVTMWIFVGVVFYGDNRSAERA